MKGIIFNLFEEFADQNFGEGTFEDIIGQCELSGDGTYVGPGTYSDQDLLVMVGKALELKNLPLDGALKSFGEFCFPHLVKINPAFIDPYDNFKDFIKSVDEIIHVEVRKLYPGAETPKFTYQDLSNGGLGIKYESQRKFCFLMEGLLQGCADFFKKEIEIKQTECMHNNNKLDHCTFELRF